MTGNHTQVVELSASALSEAVDSGEAIVESWRRDLLLLAGHPTAGADLLTDHARRRGEQSARWSR